MNESMVPCPLCGEDIDADAEFCRHCGSSDSDGWRDDDLGVDDQGSDDFDYDQYVQDNFPDSPIATQMRPLWKIVAIVLLFLILLGYLLS